MLYSVMLVGVYISSSNQGLSCLEWPLCPNGFGMPSEKHFFEHYHRVMVVITAGLVFAAAAYSFTKFKPARKTAIIAAIVISVQIVFGMVVVTTRLEPLLVAIHLRTGIVRFPITQITFLPAYQAGRQQTILHLSQHPQS